MVLSLLMLSQNSITYQNLDLDETCANTFVYFLLSRNITLKKMSMGMTVGYSSTSKTKTQETSVQVCQKWTKLNYASYYTQNSD